jgi:hypothetical protein
MSKLRLSRFPDLHDLELVCAAYSSRAFPRHMHEQYVVGIRE